jgi:hypothetical protein
MNPKKDIVNRKIDKEPSKILNMMGRTIDEFVDYGGEIYNNICDSYKFDELELPIPLTFMQVLDLLDSMAILTKKGQSEGIKPILRSLFETVLTLEHLIKVPRQAGVISYQVAHAHKQMSLRIKLDPKTEQGKQFKQMNSRVYPGMVLPEYSADEINKHLKKFLERDDIKEVNELWMEKKKQRKRIPEWFSLYSDASNLKELSCLYNLDPFYEVLYPMLSGVAHATGLVSNIKIAGQNTGVIPGIRKLGEVQGLIVHALNLVLHIFREVLQKYSPKNVKKFSLWYIENVREEVMLYSNGNELIKTEYIPVKP